MEPPPNNTPAGDLHDAQCLFDDIVEKVMPDATTNELACLAQLLLMQPSKALQQARSWLRGPRYLYLEYLADLRAPERYFLAGICAMRAGAQASLSGAAFQEEKERKEP